MGNGPLKQTRRIPPAGKSHLGLVGHWIGWVRVGGGAAQDCTELGVELGEPLVLALELPHPLLVRDLSAIELDLSQLVVDNGAPVQQLLRRSLRLR